MKPQKLNAYSLNGSSKRIVRVSVIVILAFLGCNMTGGGFSSEVLNDPTNSERRALLHKKLDEGDIHDSAIDLCQVGDETSVPHLINALKSFANDGDLIECTQSHCVEALQRITNNSPGKDYISWNTWWLSNKEKSRAEWINDGFRAIGLGVTIPPDAQYVRELILQMQSEEEFRVINAERVLSGVPAQLLQSQMELCLTSAEPKERMGAVVTLSAMKDPKALERFQVMTADEDPDVRMLALQKLNDIRRNVPGIPPDEQVLWKGTLGGDIDIISQGPDNHHLFVGYTSGTGRRRDSRLGFFNLETKMFDWEISCPNGVNSSPVTDRNEIFFICSHGQVFCVNLSDGKTIWRQETCPTCFGTMLGKVFSDENIVVANNNSILCALDRSTGQELWRIIDKPYIDCEYVNGKLFVASVNRGFQCIDVKGAVLYKKSGVKPRIFCSTDTMLFVSEGKESPVLSARDLGTFEPVWELPLGMGSDLVTVQSEKFLIVGQRNAQYYGINKSSGRVLWSVPDRNCEPYGIVGNQFITVGGSRPTLELRDLETGQITMAYDKPVIFSGRCVAVMNDSIITAPMRIDEAGDKDNLWVLKVPR